MKACIDCNKEIFGWKAKRCKSCAKKGTHLSEEAKRKVSESHKGNKHYGFVGRYKDHGYVFIYKPDHPFCNSKGYVYEHRLVMEQKIGRFLLPKEVIDHINRIRDDNSPENLQLMKNQSNHMKTEWSKGTFNNRPKMKRDSFGRFV